MLKFDHVSFSYGDKKILSDFSLHLQKGEILAIMGPSGFGKSTILNLAAGLLKPDNGEIHCQTDHISYVFQEPRLFPWLNVEKNVSAVLNSKTDDLGKATLALEFVNMKESAALFPDELSGGMKSRVSLARAIAYDGDLYLLDEPFAALDEELREALSSKLRTHIKERGASCIFITHHLADAQAFADNIITI
ncbi:MAG: ABC transporter ATP-binding protein [Clostridia bacterium]|nr:ABC transporter ATP-binding protein [Clostridia bacterium]